jgi:3D (Asp-Asp-Asp) domain-containing protein
MGFIGFSSFFTNVSYKEENYEVINNMANKSSNLTVNIEVLNYSTKYVYNNDLEVGNQNISVTGEEGYKIYDSNTGLVTLEKNPVDEVIEIGTKQIVYNDVTNNDEILEVYTGISTAYGPDCYGCTGYVACPTKSGTTYNLITNGIYYNDDDYGYVRVLAADNSKFPCGTIIKVESSGYDVVLGVVLDTGQSMRDAWSIGNIHIDIAFETESSALTYATNSNTNYTILRWGW